MPSAALEQANGAPAACRELMVFQVGGQEFGVDVTQVKEIRLSAPATMIPRSPPYVLGVVNLRGVVLPIVDLGARLEMPAREPAARPVVVVVWIDKKLTGLLVDAVVDILAVSEDGFQATPAVGCEAVRTLVNSIVRADDRTIGLIELDQILPAGEDQDR